MKDYSGLKTKMKNYFDCYVNVPYDMQSKMIHRIRVH